MVSMAAGGRNGTQTNGLHLGVTEPISTAGPTELDLQKTRELEKVVAELSSSFRGLVEYEASFWW
jgi:hypothetical protein